MPDRKGRGIGPNAVRNHENNQDARLDGIEVFLADQGYVPPELMPEGPEVDEETPEDEDDALA